MAMLHTCVEASCMRSHGSRRAVPWSALFAALCRLCCWSSLLGIQGQQGCGGERLILSLGTLPGQQCCCVRWLFLKHGGDKCPVSCSSPSSMAQRSPQCQDHAAGSKFSLQPMMTQE